MSNNLTAKQLELIRNRKTVLNESLKALSELIEGHSSSLSPFTADENGKISEERVNTLISELIDCLNRCRRLEKRRTLNKKTEELYRAFLYLSIWGPFLSSDSLIRPAESFSDIIEFAKGFEDSGFEERVDLLMADLNGYVTRYCGNKYGADIQKNGSFGILLWVMRDYMEHFALLSFSREEQIMLCGLYAKRFGLSEKEKQQLTEDVLYQLYDYEKDMEKYNEYLIGLAAEEEAEQRAEYEKEVKEGRFEGTFAEYQRAELDRSDPITDEDVARLFGDEAEIEDENATAEWLDLLVDPRRYCKCFDAFVESYFQIDRAAFVNDISDMLDAFLFEHKLSAFSFGDDYLMINYYLEQSRNRVETEIARGIGK